jgi:hypothetical protein
MSATLLASRNGHAPARPEGVPTPAATSAEPVRTSTSLPPAEVPPDRPRCSVMPHGEPCRYPARLGTDWCSTHLPYPGRRVDMTGFCTAWRPMLAARCQAYRLPGSTFCAEHDGKPSTRLAPPVGAMARLASSTSENGRHPARTPARQADAPPPTNASPPERAARPTLPAGERQARSAVITAMGNNPAAILVTIGILVETGAGPLSWSSLAGAARREGLLPPPGSSGLGGMLLEALTR